MDMSMVEKRKVAKVENNFRKNLAFAYSISKVVCAFIALSQLLKSDLNVARNPGVGSFLISAGVCGFLFASIISFLNDNR